MNIIFISAGLFIWAFLGGIFYIYMFNKVSLPYQRVVLWIVSGPLLWVLTPVFKGLDIFAEKVFEPFYKWLTKE